MLRGTNSWQGVVQRTNVTDRVELLAVYELQPTHQAAVACHTFKICDEESQTRNSEVCRDVSAVVAPGHHGYPRAEGQSLNSDLKGQGFCQPGSVPVRPVTP